MAITKFVQQSLAINYLNDDTTIVMPAGPIFSGAQGTPTYSTGSYVVEFTIDAEFNEDPPSTLDIPAVAIYDPTLGARVQRRKNGNIDRDGLTVSSGNPVLVAGDKVTFTVNIDTGDVSVYLNGTFETTQTVSFNPDVSFDGAVASTGDQITVNGAGSFQIAVPPGFLPWDGVAANIDITGTITNCTNDISRYVRAYDWATHALLGSTTVDMTVTQDYTVSVPAATTDYFLVSVPVTHSLLSAGRKILTTGVLTV